MTTIRVRSYDEIVVRLSFLGLVALSSFACAVGAADLSADVMDAFAECATGGEVGQRAGDVVYHLNPLIPQRRWPGVLGFNPSFAAGDGRGDFQGSAFSRLVGMFSPQALRYPPGTYATFYDWDSMVIDEQLAKRHANKAMLASIRHQRKRADGRLIASDYRSFLAMARARSQNPFIVLNLMTADATHARSAISKVKRQFDGTIFWELGNEVANSEYQRLRLPAPWSVETYVERVAAISRYIKDGYPGDRIGAVGADLLVERGHVRAPAAVERMSKRWAERMSNAAEFYDAVIFHPYINLVDDVINVGLLHSRSVAACSGLSRDVLRAVVQYRWIFSAAQEAPARYSVYSDIYHPGKDLWLTEIGLFGDKAKAPLDLSAYGVPRLLFNVAYFAHWVDRVPGVRAYMFHVLDYGKGEFAALNPDGSLNANSVSYLLLRYMLDHPDGLSVQAFGQDRRLEGVGPYQGSAISQIVALMSNGGRDGRALVVNLSPFQGRLAAPYPVVRIRTLGGAPSARIPPGRIRALDDIPAVMTEERVLVLPPLSISLIEQVS
ncbi:MAG: hypothetical protein ACOY5W_02170 [Pseudomonadota bacterium]